MDSFLAYIDPGTGSLVLQAVIAGIVAVPFFLRHHIRRFIGVVRRGQRRDAVESSTPDDATRP